jgi:hypothetical protein
MQVAMRGFCLTAVILPSLKGKNLMEIKFSCNFEMKISVEGVGLLTALVTLAGELLNLL